MLAVLLDSGDDSRVAYGPFYDQERDIAQRFADFLTAEVDPASVVPADLVTDVEGIRSVTRSAALGVLLGWYERFDRQSNVPEAVILPACWPPIPGDAWSVKPGGTWITYTYFAQDTPDGMRMIPARIGTDTDDALSPDELLKQGELKLLYRNPEEPPF